MPKSEKRKVVPLQGRYKYTKMGLAKQLFMPSPPKVVPIPEPIKTMTMRDEISLARCQLLHPRVVKEVIDTITKVEAGFPANIKVRVVQGLRTIAEQNALYAKGRTAPGPKVTNAKGGSSYHNYGLAIDFALMYDKDSNGQFEELSWNTTKDGDQDGLIDWQEMVSEFKALGWQWGGDFRTFLDYPHIQKSFGYTVKQLLNKVNTGQLVDGYVIL